MKNIHSTKGQVSPAILIWVGLPFLGFLLVIVMSWSEAHKAAAMYRILSAWVPADGMITVSKVNSWQRQESRGGSRGSSSMVTVTVHAPEVRYTYKAGTEVLTGQEIRFRHPQVYRQRERAEEVQRRYTVGQAVEVHYNPARPEQCWLENPRPEPIEPGKMIVVCLFILLAGCCQFLFFASGGFLGEGFQAQARALEAAFPWLRRLSGHRQRPPR